MVTTTSADSGSPMSRPIALALVTVSGGDQWAWSMCGATSPPR